VDLEPVNYYEHHIGDYAEATSHLSILEDGVYSRLIRKYYAKEGPLPGTLEAVCDLINARTKPERAAVEKVLKSFFELGDDGFHQDRCDEEIARYLEAEPERQAKRENDKERKRRSRERRAQLFEELRAADIVPRWDTPMAELERLRGKLNGHRPVTRDKTVTVTPVTHSGHRPVTRDGTATHIPVPTPQAHIPNKDTPPTPSRGRVRADSKWRPPTDEELGLSPPKDAHARD
jgi:uncharacterized protein YdaU (DUF1376 family)